MRVQASGGGVTDWTHGWRKLMGLVLLVAFLGLGWLILRAAGVRVDPETLQDSVREFGVWAPALFLVIAVFRHFLGIPSTLMLVAAGACFGAIWGTILGALGLLGSALWLFGLTRWLGRDAARARLSSNQKRALEILGESPGAFLVAIATAYPIGTSLYWLASALTSIRLSVFALAVTFGALVRATLLSFLGASLIEWNVGSVLVALLALLLCLGLPLLHEGTRAWFMRLRGALRGHE